MVGPPEAPYDDAGVRLCSIGGHRSAWHPGSTYLACGGSGVAPGMTVGDPQLAQAVLLKRNPAPTGSTDQTARIGVTRIPAAMDGTGR